MDTQKWIVAGWIVSGFIGALCGWTKGSPGWGMIFGLLLGPLGWILILQKNRESSTDSYWGTLALAALFAGVFAVASVKEKARATENLHQLQAKLTQGDDQGAADAPADSGSQGAAGTPIRSGPILVKKEDLFEVCGKVVSVLPEGIRIEGIDPAVELNGGNGLPYVDPGANALYRTAKTAAERSDKTYGQLMTLQRGFLTPSAIHPMRYVTGPLLLTGLPPGMHVWTHSNMRILVAWQANATIDGTWLRVYNCNLQFAPEAAGSWMENSGKTLQGTAPSGR